MLMLTTHSNVFFLVFRGFWNTLQQLFLTLVPPVSLSTQEADLLLEGKIMEN